MRNIIYITGITASGKTTLAEKLSDHLGIPFFKADDVYSMIAKEINWPRQEQLVLPEFWAKFPKFGLLKLKYYRELLKDVTGDFIIEGFPLFFEQDRQLIKQVVGEHFATFFRLNLSYKQWQKYANLKFGGSNIERDFAMLNSYFEAPAFHYDITNPEILFTHYEEYQRLGFTDKKWELLKLDKETLAGKSVIDLGCNEGWIGKNCLDLGAAEVSGVDYNWRYLEKARASGLNVELQDLDNYEFKQHFDIVVCLAVFHYVEFKMRFIKKIAEATNELFILEIPVSEQEGKMLVLHDTGQCIYFIPTIELITYWLDLYFKKVDISNSVAPDDSKRIIFKCYK